MVQTIDIHKVQDVGKEKAAVVMFSASWCAGCKAVKPVYEEASDKCSNVLDFYYTEVDDDIEEAEKYGVRNLPAVVLFENGEKVKAVAGQVDKAKITDVIQSYL